MKIHSPSPAPFDAFIEAQLCLPELPNVIQYDDDYDEVTRSIKAIDLKGPVAVIISGGKLNLDLSLFDWRVRRLLTVHLINTLQTLSPQTAMSRYYGLLKIDPSDLEELITSEPLDARAIWRRLTPKYKPEILGALRTVLMFLCRVNFLKWTQLHTDLVSNGFPLKYSDNYAAVRSGDCFLSTQEEAEIIRWIDDKAQAPTALSLKDLQIACLMTAIYQFGMRPKQIGMVRHRDLTVRESKEDAGCSAYITFKMIKQQDSLISNTPLLRKVRREWAPLFSALKKRVGQERPNDFLFGFNNRMAISKAVIGTLDEIVPGIGGKAYDLRHSLAQRMVDAGASQEELAAAMGHSCLRSGLIYFTSSANQAEIINKALGASSVYQKIASVAQTKFITPDELMMLKGESQIGGAPHGIPIAGIGGCTTGQPSCPYNPITACYGCPKFMPVNDLGIHQSVLKKFRGVVLQFKDIGHGELNSPAYLQLQRTLACVQAVISELDGSSKLQGE